MSLLKVFLSSAIFSFRAQFGWLYPPMWLTMKLIMSLSQMSFFVFVARFLVTASNATSADLIGYIAVGNAMSVLSWNTVFSVINITSHDKWDGTLPLVLATPAHRLPLFVGRAMMHVFDGMLSVVIGLVYAAFLFGVDFGNADIAALSVVIFLTSFSMAGFGLLIGGFSLYYRDPLVFANVFTFVLLILCGVNFPIQELPCPLQAVSYIFPLTYGLDAGRRTIAGASLAEITPSICQMMAVGFISIILGYVFFRSFEHVARKTGRLEAL